LVQIQNEHAENNQKWENRLRELEQARQEEQSQKESIHAQHEKYVSEKNIHVEQLNTQHERIVSETNQKVDQLTDRVKQLEEEKLMLAGNEKIQKDELAQKVEQLSKQNESIQGQVTETKQLLEETKSKLEKSEEALSRAKEEHELELTQQKLLLEQKSSESEQLEPLMKQIEELQTIAQTMTAKDQENQEKLTAAQNRIAEVEKLLSELQDEQRKRVEQDRMKEEEEQLLKQIQERNANRTRAPSVRIVKPTTPPTIDDQGPTISSSADRRPSIRKIGNIRSKIAQHETAVEEAQKIRSSARPRQSIIMLKQMNAGVPVSGTTPPTTTPAPRQRGTSIIRPRTGPVVTNTETTTTETVTTEEAPVQRPTRARGVSIRSAQAPAPVPATTEDYTEEPTPAPVEAPKTITVRKRGTIVNNRPAPPQEKPKLEEIVKQGYLQKEYGAKFTSWTRKFLIIQKYVLVKDTNSVIGTRLQELENY
jgi:hypothetical protein